MIGQWGRVRGAVDHADAGRRPRRLPPLPAGPHSSPPRLAGEGRAEGGERAGVRGGLTIPLDALRIGAATGPHSSGTPARRRPAKYVASNKARTFGTPKYP